MFELNKKIAWVEIDNHLYIESDTVSLELDKVGIYIFKALADNKTPAEIVKGLNSVYADTPEDVIRGDVNGVIAALRGKHIIDTDEAVTADGQNDNYPTCDSYTTDNNDYLSQKSSGDKLIDKYIGIAKRDNRPFNVTFDTTTNCNFDCVHCCVGHRDKVPDIPFFRFEETIAKIKTMGGFNFTITGGEPLLRKDIEYIIKSLRRLGYKTSIITNGSLLDEDIINICEALAVPIRVSIYGGDEETYLRVTGKSGFFKKVIEALDGLYENQNDFSISITLTKENIESIDEFRKIFEKYGKPVQYNIVLHSRPNGDRKPIKHVITRELLGKYKRKIPLIGEEEIKRKTAFKPYCGAGRSSIYIGPDGASQPCLYLPITLGNALVDDVEEFWENNEDLRYLRSIRSDDYIHCKDCDLYRWCDLCIGRNYTKNGNYFVPDGDACSMSKKVKTVSDFVCNGNNR